jgi:hypothetical protein
MEGFPSPEAAALASMPAANTHVVHTSIRSDGSAWVLLATEVVGVAGAAYYLDENICERFEDGSWGQFSSCGSDFTDRSLDQLRADPPLPTLFS